MDLSDIGSFLLKAAAAAATITWGCGSGKELPTLAIGEDDVTSPDVSETETAVSKDGAAEDGEAGALGSDTPQGVDGTSADQAAEETSVPTEDEFLCMVMAEDCYGMKYGMYLESEDHVIYSGDGFAGIMRFQNALDADTALETERQTEPASNWMQEGMTVPGFAQNLTGRYEISVDTSSGLLTCLNLDADNGDSQDATLLPMTWLDDASGSPEPISQDAHNEVYIALEPGLKMAISSSDEDHPASFGGTNKINIFNNPAITGGCPDSTVNLTIGCLKK